MEKGAAIAVRVVIGVVAVALRAIGLIALDVMVDRCRSVRVAALHKFRLMADMIRLASVAPREASMQLRRKKAGVVRVFLRCKGALAKMK